MAKTAACQDVCAIPKEDCKIWNKKEGNNLVNLLSKSEHRSEIIPAASLKAVRKVRPRVQLCLAFPGSSDKRFTECLVLNSAKDHLSRFFTITFNRMFTISIRNRMAKANRSESPILEHWINSHIGGVFEAPLQMTVM